MVVESDTDILREIVRSNDAALFRDVGILRIQKTSTIEGLRWFLEFSGDDICIFRRLGNPIQNRFIGIRKPRCKRRFRIVEKIYLFPGISEIFVDDIRAGLFEWRHS